MFFAFFFRFDPNVFRFEFEASCWFVNRHYCVIVVVSLTRSRRSCVAHSLNHIRLNTFDRRCCRRCGVPCEFMLFVRRIRCGTHNLLPWIKVASQFHLRYGATQLTKSKKALSHKPKLIAFLFCVFFFSSSFLLSSSVFPLWRRKKTNQTLIGIRVSAFFSIDELHIRFYTST